MHWFSQMFKSFTLNTLFIIDARKCETIVIHGNDVCKIDDAQFLNQNIFLRLQVVELNDALAINSTSVRLDWHLHISGNEGYIEVCDCLTKQNTSSFINDNSNNKQTYITMQNWNIHTYRYFLVFLHKYHFEFMTKHCFDFRLLLYSHRVCTFDSVIWVVDRKNTI